MNRVSAITPGKTILFGEHAVVYGFPAIAMAISKASICTIEQIQNKKIEFILKDYDKHYEFSNYNDFLSNFPENIHALAYALMYFTENFQISIEGILITISSSLIPSSGLGSSASIAVSLVAALSGFYEISMEKQEISQLAYEMEKIIHGAPSGIDNNICTFGKLLIFKKGLFEFINYPKDLTILITNTNLKHNTRIAIEKIKTLMESKPKFISSIFKKIGKISDSAVSELKKENYEKLGILMNKNQELLTTLEVSNDTIAEINTIALNNGAYGSKLTGAGLGGCVISLGKEESLVKISHLLKNKKYQSFLSTVNQEGVKIEGIW